MQTIKIEGSIYKTVGLKEISYLAIKPDSTFWKNPSYIFIAPYTIEVELNGDLEKMIQEKTLNSLQISRKLILAENEAKIQKIDQLIQEHLAIEA